MFDYLTSRTSTRYISQAGGDIRFVHRIYHLRMLGLGLGVLCAASVFWQNGANALAWTLLAVDGFVWPHVAFRLARRSADPCRTELCNLMVDSAAGGAWIALMGFNLLPSLLYVTMLSVDKINVGGWRLLARTATWQISACVFTWLVFRTPVRLESSTLTVIACLPFLVTYPVVLSTVTYGLARRVRHQNRQLEELNRTDALTGLPNRRYWEETAANELRRYHRSGRRAALMLFDIDEFKRINDSNGHAGGDDVLRRCGNILRESLRDIDTPCRYGGDEFGVILPETDAAGAKHVADELHRLVAAAGGGWTISVGIAELDRETVALADWVGRADAALYRAKEKGRNRTVLQPQCIEYFGRGGARCAPDGA